MSLVFKPTSHRYYLDGVLVRGVTGLIGGGVPKPALMRWYGRTIAEFVEANPQEIERLRADESSNFVRELLQVPDRIRDDKAAIGTEVHRIAQDILAGKEVDVQERHVPYIEGFLHLLDTWDIQPVLTEVSVGSRLHQYAGRLDSIATVGGLGGDLCLIDWKTSNGLYGETSLQAAAYARAEFYVDDDDSEEELELPQVTRTLVAHLTPTGAFLYDLSRDSAEIDVAFQEFLCAASIAKTAKIRAERIGAPLQPLEEKAA